MQRDLAPQELIKMRGELNCYYKITFFVPCRNEEFSILKTLRKIVALANERGLSFEILVYNDESTDKTQNIVEQFINDHPKINIRLFNLKKRRGLGFNYIAGAFEGFGEYYMMICGDDSETPKSMHQILELMDKADMIIPYFEELDTRLFLRKTLSKTFSFIVNLVGGRNLRYYNGTVLHKRLNVIRWAPPSSGFAYQAELLGILLDQNKTYVEIQISNNDREKGVSRAFTMLNFFSITHSLVQIFFRRIRRKLWPLH